jgi:hypothetical protein
LSRFAYRVCGTKPRRVGGAGWQKISLVYTSSTYTKAEQITFQHSPCRSSAVGLVPNNLPSSDLISRPQRSTHLHTPNMMSFLSWAIMLHPHVNCCVHLLSPDGVCAIIIHRHAKATCVPLRQPLPSACRSVSAHDMHHIVVSARSVAAEWV